MQMDSRISQFEDFFIDVQVGEWFFNINGQNTLVEFENVADPVPHNDVVIYDTTVGVAFWNVDPNTIFTVVASSMGGTITNPNRYTDTYNGSGIHNIFSFLNGDTSVSAQINYYGTNLTPFLISLESGNKTVINVVQKQIVPSQIGTPGSSGSQIPGTILSYGLDPSALVTYSNSARIKTTNARITLHTDTSNGNIMTIENDKPNNNDKERSTIYIKTSTSMQIYEIYTWPIPYAQNSNILVEIYNNDPGSYWSNPYVISYNFPTTGNFPAITLTSGNPITTVGQSTLTYTFFDYGYGLTLPNANAPTFHAIVSVIDVPPDVEDNRILEINVPYKFNPVTDYFGGNASTIRLDSVTATTTVGADNIQSSIVFQPTGEVTMESLTAGSTYSVVFACSGSASRIPTVESVVDQLKSKNIKVSDFLLSITITFISYDPATTPHYVLANTVGNAAVTFPGIFAFGGYYHERELQWCNSCRNKQCWFQLAHSY